MGGKSNEPDRNFTRHLTPSGADDDPPLPLPLLPVTFIGGGRTFGFGFGGSFRMITGGPNERTSSGATSSAAHTPIPTETSSSAFPFPLRSASGIGCSSGESGDERIVCDGPARERAWSDEKYAARRFKRRREPPIFALAWRALHRGKVS